MGKRKFGAPIVKVAGPTFRNSRYSIVVFRKRRPTRAASNDYLQTVRKSDDASDTADDLVSTTRFPNVANRHRWQPEAILNLSVGFCLSAVFCRMAASSLSFGDSFSMSEVCMGEGSLSMYAPEQK